MAQQLGIKVKIDLPSKDALEKEFKSKWSAFKGDYTAKVNVAVDKNSLAQMGSQLSRFFKNKKIEIKPTMDASLIHKELSKLTSNFRRLRDEMQQGLNLKVNIDGKSEFDRLMKGSNLSSGAQNAVRNYEAGAKRSFENIGSSFTKMQTRMAKGNVYTTLNQEAGKFGELQTKLINGQKEGETYSLNQAKAVKEVTATMRELNAIEVKQLSAGKDEYAALEERKQRVQQHLAFLQREYKQEFKGSPNENFAVREAESIAKMNLQISKAAESKRTESALNKDVANSLSEVVKLENQKYQLTSKRDSAGNREKRVIDQQVAALDKRSKAIQKASDFENMLTSHQKETLAVIKQQNDFKLQNSRAAQRDKAQAQVQMNTYRELKADLKEVLNLERQLNNLNVKAKSNGLDAKGHDKRAALQTELNARRELYNMTQKQAQSEGKISSEANQSLSSMRSAASAQMKIESAVSQTEAKMSNLNRHYDKLESSIKTVARLQQDMSRSGDREARVVRDQINAEERKQAAIRETIGALKVENRTREQSIRKQVEQNSENRHYAERRQRAGEMDNHSGGLSTMYDPLNVLQSAKSGFMTILQSVGDVDKRITEVSKVAQAPEAELKAFADTIYDTASSVGKGADQYAESVARWVTTGKTLQESTVLAKDSVMGSFVGSLDEEDMVTYMSVPMNAWKKDMLDSKDVINAMNEVANTNAIEMDDLGKAYQRAATTAATSGTSFAEMTGMVTAAQESTRAGGEKIGTAMRAMDVNFGKISSKISKGDESKFNWFKDIGVNIQNGNGELRSTFDIMTDLSKVWSKLSTNDKSTAGFFAAGKLHSAVFAGMMNNWNTAIRATAQAQRQVNLVRKDQGSAFQEFAKQQGSVEFHMAAVKNSWGKFLSSAIGGKDGVNQILTAGDRIIKIMTRISDNPLLSKGIKTAALTTGFVAAQTLITKFTRTLSRGFQDSNRAIISSVQRMTGYTSATNRATASQLKLNAAMAASEKARKVGVGTTTTKMFDRGSIRYNPKVKLDKSAFSGIDREAKTLVGQKMSRVQFDGINANFKKAKMDTSGLKSVVSESGKAASAFSKVGGGALRAGATIGKSFLSVIPIVGNVISVIGLLEAFGFKPLEKIGQAFDFIGGNANVAAKRISEVKSVNDKLSKEIMDNPIFNGQSLERKKIGDSFQSVLNNAQKTANDANKSNRKQGIDADTVKPSLNPEEFMTFRDDFNKFAKENNIDIDIKVNDYDSLMGKVKDLNKELAKARAGDLTEGFKAIDKQLDNQEKLANEKDPTSDLMGTKSYKDKYSGLMQGLGAEVSAAGGDVKKAEEATARWKQALAELNAEYMNGEKGVEYWTSKTGKAIAKQHRENAKSISDEMASLSKNTGEGLFSRDEMEMMDKGDRQKLEVAQASNLNAQFEKRGSILDGINKKLEEGKKLSIKDIEELAAHDPDVGTKQQNQWNEDDYAKAIQAAQSGKKALNEEKSSQEKIMSDILKAGGMTTDNIKSTIAEYEKGGSAFVRMMAKQGELGESVMKVSAQFKQMHGEDWVDVMGGLQDKVEAIPEEKVTKYSFIDETTGLIDTELIMKLNNIPKEKLTKYGIQYDENNNLDAGKLIDSLGKIPEDKLTKYTVDGVLEADTLLNDLANNADSVPTDLKMYVMASTEGFDTNFQKALADMDSADGREATMKFLADNNYFGLKKAEVDKWLSEVDNKEAKAKIKADNEDAKNKAKEAKNEVDKVPNQKTTKIKAENGDHKQKTNQAKKDANGVPTSKTTSYKGKDSGASAASKTVKANADKIPTLKSTKFTGNSSSAVGAANGAKKGIEGVPSRKHSTITGNSGNSQNASRGAKSAIESVPKSKHSSITASGNAASKAREARGEIASVQGKRVTIDIITNKITNIIQNVKKAFGGGKGGSVAIEAEVATANPAKSLSRAIGSAKKAASKDRSASSSEKNARVSEDVWRYWNKELYTGKPLDQKGSKLETAITQAKDNMDKLIKLYKQKIDLDNKELNYQRSMKGAKQSELRSIMSQLGKYGFNRSGNKITNLNRARSLRGDKATKANELLTKYKTLYESLAEIDGKIDSLNKDKWDQNEKIKESQKTKENKRIESLQRKLELAMSALSGTTNILEKKLGEINGSDFELKLAVSEETMNNQAGNVKALIAQFNSLSKLTFSDPEQSKKLQGNLETLKNEILSNADAVIKLRKEINQTQIDRITSDVDRFTKNLDTNISKLKNNIDNMKEGFLSGTGINDLSSSSLTTVDFSRKTALDRELEERLKLQKALDQALSLYAQKNVDRTKKVAEKQLKIEQSKYNALLQIAKNFSKGKSGNVNLDGINTGIGINSAKPDKGTVQMENNLQSVADKFIAKFNKLKEKYSGLLSAASTPAEKEAINQQFILDQMKLQEEANRGLIAGNKEAIKQLKEKLKLKGLSTEQIDKINSTIAGYEKEVMDSENAIKDSIKSRYDYEFEQMKVLVDEYRKSTDKIAGMLSLAGVLGLDKGVKGELMGLQFDSSFKEYSNYIEQLKKLKEEQSGFTEGSYEHNILQKQIDEMLKNVSTATAELVELNKKKYGNTLDELKEEIEKSVNGGQTSEELKFSNEIWLKGVQKELEVQRLREKMLDLEDETIKKRLEALDAQKEISKIEAEYLDKQLDVLSIQEKLEKAKGKKDVQVLEKDENGNFSWGYHAKQDDIDKLNEDLNKAETELEKLTAAKKDEYLNKVGAIITGAKEGELTPEEVKQRLAELGESYGSILQDIPTFDSDKIEEILAVYNDYVEANKDILDKYGEGAGISQDESFQSLINGFADQFKVVSKDLGEIFGKEIQKAFKLPSGMNLNDRGSSMIIQNQTIELPNVTDAKGFEDVFMTLPELAKQKAQSK